MVLLHENVFLINSTVKEVHLPVFPLIKDNINGYSGFVFLNNYNATLRRTSLKTVVFGLNEEYNQKAGKMG